MAHSNRKKVSIPVRVVQELCVALDSCCTQMEMIQRAEDNLDALADAVAFGRRTLDETRRRLKSMENTHAEPSGNRL